MCFGCSSFFSFCMNFFECSLSLLRPVDSLEIFILLKFCYLFFYFVILEEHCSNHFIYVEYVFSHLKMFKNSLYFISQDCFLHLNVKLQCSFVYDFLVSCSISIFSDKTVLKGVFQSGSSRTKI